jgi:hypothetical protein
MGLKLVGRLCGAHGWVVDGDRQVVVRVQFGAVAPNGVALGRRVFPRRLPAPASRAGSRGVAPG